MDHLKKKQKTNFDKSKLDDEIQVEILAINFELINRKVKVFNFRFLQLNGSMAERNSSSKQRLG